MRQGGNAMKILSVYEAIAAGMLSVSVIVASNSIAGDKSVLNRTENIVLPETTISEVLITPAPTDEISVKASPLEMLNSEVLNDIDLSDLEPAFPADEEEYEEVIAETAETTAAPSETEADAAVETSDSAPSEESSAAETSADTTTATTTTTETTETNVAVVEETSEPEPEPEPEPSYSINYPPAGTEEYELFILINDARAANGLPPLSWSGGLADAAYVRAGEAVDCFSHTRPDGSDWWTVNPSIMYGENLAQGQTNAQWVFNDWMNSPTHRENILGDYTIYGSARVGDTWAQEFG